MATASLQLSLMIDATGLSPEAQMRQLGEVSKRIMQARVKALRDGLTAIHTELVRFSDEITRKQAELLAVHPELILMSMEVK